MCDKFWSDCGGRWVNALYRKYCYWIIIVHEIRSHHQLLAQRVFVFIIAVQCVQYLEWEFTWTKCHPTSFTCWCFDLGQYKQKKKVFFFNFVNHYQWMISWWPIFCCDSNKNVCLWSTVSKVKKKKKNWFLLRHNWHTSNKIVIFCFSPHQSVHECWVKVKGCRCHCSRSVNFPCWVKCKRKSDKCAPNYTLLPKTIHNNHCRHYFRRAHFCEHN